MTRALTLLVTMFVPMPMLAVPILGRADEPAKQQDRSRAMEKVQEELRKRVREEGLIVFDEDEKAVQELQAKIEKEIDSLGNHPWAGQYYWGDGLSNSYLYVAPGAGFLFMYCGDTGVRYANHGPVEQTDGGLNLLFSQPLKQGRFCPGLSKRLLPIAWGERKYLVPAKELIDFCNQVNEGAEPRKDIYGFCLLRVGDEKKKVEGFPAVPRQITPYLLAKPIEADVIGVEKPTVTEGGVTTIVISVTLNRGKESGLLPGMKLHVIKPSNVFDDIAITKVDQQQSKGIITRYHLPGVWSLLSYLVESNPKVGWRLSTRSKSWTELNMREERSSANK